MLSLTARQTRLVEGAPLEPLLLFVLTVYSDQTTSPKTVDATYYWSDRHFEYDWQNTGTLRQFLPYVQRADRRLVETMPHLPSGGTIEGELVRPYQLVLANARQDDGTLLMETLSAENLEYSDLVVAELLLDPAVAGGEDPATLTGDEHVVLGRYQLHQVRDVTVDEISIDFETARLEGLLPAPVVGPDVAPRDLGKRPAVPFGAVKRVPCLGIQVGPTSTLAQPMTLDSTQITISDAAKFPNAGLVYVGGEAIQYSGKSSNTLLSLTRDVVLKAEHNHGELVVFVPTKIVYAVGDGGTAVSAVDDVWMRSPETGEVFRLNNGGSFVPNDSASLAGHTLATLTWSQNSWRNMLDEIVANSRVTSQPQFEDPTDPISTTIGAHQYATNSRQVKNGEENWASPGKADGSWNTATRTFTYNSTKSDRKLVCENDTPLPSPTRDPERARIRVGVTVLGWSGLSSAEVWVEVRPKSVLADSPLWAGLPILVETIATGEGSYSFETNWISNPDRTGATTSDSLTDELDDYELDVFFRVIGGGGVAQFVAQVTDLAIEYEYVSGGTLLDLKTPVAIRAFTGGAGVELFADVQGPLSPVAAYALGYDFPDEDWTNVDSVDTAVTDGRKFANAGAWTSRFDLDTDASNWSLQTGMVDVLLSDATSPANNESLKMTLVQNPLWIDGQSGSEAANWSGPYMTDGESGGSKYIEFNPPALATTFSERALSAADDWSQWVLHVTLAEVIDLSRITDLYVRVHDGVNYHEFHWSVPEAGEVSFGKALLIDLTDPTNDAHYNATSGTPDLTQVSKIAIGLTTTSGGTDRRLRLRQFKGRRILFERFDVYRTLSAEDWSAREELRFKVYIPNDTTGQEVLQVFFLLETSSVVWTAFQWTIGASQTSTTIPLGQETTLNLDLADLVNDPAYHSKGPSGDVDLSNVNKIFILALVKGIDPEGFVSTVGPPDQVLYFSDIDTRDAIPTTGFIAGVAPGSTTDLDSTSDRYEVDFLLRGGSAAGEVEIIISEDTPSPITNLPTNYKKVTLAFDDYDPEVRQTAILIAETVGTPGPLDDVQTLQVRILDATSAGAEVELYSIKKTDDVSSYKAASGAVLEHPADVVRWILTERLGLDPAVINETSWSAAETNLGTNKVSAVLGELGDRFYEILARLGYEHRCQLITEETAARTEYRLLAAQSGHDWPSPAVATITEWQRLTEDRRDAFTVSTRGKLVYDLDRAAGAGGSIDDYRASLRADPDVNDSSLATVDITNAEKAYGVREGPMTGLRSVVEKATAVDILTHNLRAAKASSGLLRVAGVPAREGYALERGDIVTLDEPDWRTAAVTGRVIEKVRTYDEGMSFEFVLVEVAVS